MVRPRFDLLRRVGRDVCRHWQGRLSLAASFWVNGVGINLVLGLSLFELARWMRDSTLGRIQVLAWAAHLLLLVVGVWQWRGIWRASARAKTHRFARLLARACVLGSMVHAAVATVNFAARRHALASEKESYSVRMLGKPDEAELRGALGDGASHALVELLTRHPGIRTLHVTSPGGLGNEGLRIANVVRERRLRVVVDSLCSSACTLVLLASHERVIRPNAVVGFHRARGGDGQDIVAARDEMAEALWAVGASEAFVEQVQTTPSYDMWKPPPRRLLREGVVTSIAEPEQFVYCPPNPSVEDARLGLKQEGAFAAMAELDPLRFERVVDDYMAGPEQGRTLAEATARLSAEEGALLEKASCHPALVTARAWAVQHAHVVTAISQRFPERCADVHAGHFTTAGLTAEELGDDYQRIVKDFILQSQRAPSPKPTAEERAAALSALRAKLSPATQKIIEDRKHGRPGATAALCAAAVEHARATAELEPALIVRLDRYCPNEP